MLSHRAMRRCVPLIATAWLAAVLTACTGSSGGSGARASASTPTGATTTTPAPAPTASVTPAGPTSSAVAPAIGSSVSPIRLAQLRYRFPIAGCTAHYGRSHHDYPASDMFAPRGCSYVAVIDGVVDEVTTRDVWSPQSDLGRDRGGISVSFVGVDGVRYYGSHLSALDPLVRPGAVVKAGQRLGLVGNTGNARGIATHVHFGISWPSAANQWWIRRGEINPYRYVESWRTGGNLSPVTEVDKARARAGDTSRCHNDC